MADLQNSCFLSPMKVNLSKANMWQNMKEVILQLQSPWSSVNLLRKEHLTALKLFLFIWNKNMQMLLFNLGRPESKSENANESNAVNKASANRHLLTGGQTCMKHWNSVNWLLTLTFKLTGDHVIRDWIQFYLPWKKRWRLMCLHANSRNDDSVVKQVLDQ